MFILIMVVKREMETAEKSFGGVLKEGVVKELEQSMCELFLPIFTVMKQTEEGRELMAEKPLSEMIPYYAFCKEAQADISVEAVNENYLSLEELLPTEEVVAKEATTKEQDVAEDLQELLKAENEAMLQNRETSTGFIKHTLQNDVDLQALNDYETLVQDYYTIDSNTMAGSEQLNVTNFLSKDMTLSREGEGPQILIYHTHSQETFCDSIPGDEGTSIVGVGARLSQILTEEYGYRVLHHKGKYDVETRNDAYSYSLPEIEKLLEENPSIQVIIDLHRDSMPEDTKLVMDLDGRPTARFMFFNGLSRTQQTGNIAYLYNENLEDNLAFSFQLQLKANQYYPGITRKIYLKGYRYNMHLRPRTTLIELGAQNNTVEEAMNACEPLAHILDIVLSGAN